MQTERLTILMEPQYKAAITRQAAARGVSTSEHVRNALDNFNERSSAEEAELQILLPQLNEAVPRMQASFDRMISKLDSLHTEMDDFFRARGIS